MQNFWRTLLNPARILKSSPWSVAFCHNQARILLSFRRQLLKFIFQLPNFYENLFSFLQFLYSLDVSFRLFHVLLSCWSLIWMLNFLLEGWCRRNNILKLWRYCLLSMSDIVEWEIYFLLGSLPKQMKKSEIEGFDFDVEDWGYSFRSLTFDVIVAHSLFSLMGGTIKDEELEKEGKIALIWNWGQYVA